MKTILFFLLFLSFLFSYSQTLNLPPRPVDALSGSEFIPVITSLNLDAREDSIFYQVSIGNVPDFQRNLVPINIFKTVATVDYNITYYVLPDYLAIGCDTNYFLCPMTPVLAQRVANLTDCTLTTRKMVNEIYSNASVKLAPVTMTPSAEMTTVPYFSSHNDMVWVQRSALLASLPLGELVGGNKKDVVISNGIYQSDYDRVCIYGWHQLSGIPIQPLYNGHILMYADYSHGIRLVQNEAIVNGVPMNITDILQSPDLYSLFSDEGQIDIPYYPVPEVVIEIPTSFAFEALGADNIKFHIKTESGLSYYAQFSEDGINFSDDTLINLLNPVFDTDYSGFVIYARIRASDGEYFSDPSEVLAASIWGLPGEILIVNGFDRPSSGNTRNFVIQHAEAISNSLYCFSSCTNEAMTDSLLDLVYYVAIDYILGEESSINESLNSEEQQIIANFLDNGKRLFISGSEIGWDLDHLGSASDRSFYNNYLKAEYVMDAPGNLASTYYKMEPVSSEWLYYMDSVVYDNGTHGTYNVAYPDVINGINGSQEFVYYSGLVSQFGGISFTGEFPSGFVEGKLVYLAIPFETIYPESSRNNLMVSVLAYLLGTSDVSENCEEKIIKVFPNPCSDRLNLQVPLSGIENCSVSVYDNLGRKVMSKYFKQISDELISFSIIGLKPGIYKVVVRLGDRVYVETFTCY